MGIDFSYYRRMNEMDDVPVNNGTSENSEIIERMSRILVDSNEKIIHSFDLYKRQGLLVDAIRRRGNVYDHIDIHVYYKKIKEPTLNSLARGIYADLNTLRTGDYITYADKHSGREETYMIRNKPEPKRTYEDAYMLYCNENLRWIDKDTKATHSYPCVMSHDKYIIDNRDEGIFERESSWVVVFAQANKDTLKITTGDRFLFKAIDDELSSAYEVVDTNPYALSGLNIIKVRKVKIVAQYDNVHLGIADYYKLIDGDTPVVDESQIIGDTEILLGSTNVYHIDNMDWTQYEWRVEQKTGTLGISQYLTFATDMNSDLNVNAVATAQSVGSQFYVSIYNTYTNELYLSKEVEVSGW